MLTVTYCEFASFSSCFTLSVFLNSSYFFCLSVPDAVCISYRGVDGARSQSGEKGGSLAGFGDLRSSTPQPWGPAHCFDSPVPQFPRMDGGDDSSLQPSQSCGDVR